MIRSSRYCSSYVQSTSLRGLASPTDNASRNDEWSTMMVVTEEILLAGASL